MDNYVYKMIQIPPTITVKGKAEKGNEAAAFLEIIVNQAAKEGWEFFRVDSIGVQVQSGCAGFLFGHKTIPVTYYVVTFRKSS